MSESYPYRQAPEEIEAATELEAVTMITPGYEQLGMIAVQHFMRFARCNGRPIKVNVISQAGGGFSEKLKIDRFTAPNLLWFDADWWLLRDCDFGDFLNGTFVGVNDPGVNVPTEFPREDCERHGIDKRRYVNGGLLICPRAHTSVFPLALSLFQQGGCYDFGEQSYLNLALHLLKTPISLLPFKYNFWKMAVDRGAFPFIPRGIVGLHGAGIPPEEKLLHMLAQRDVFSHFTLPLIETEWSELRNCANWRRIDDL